MTTYLNGATECVYLSYHTHGLYRQSDMFNLGPWKMSLVTELWGLQKLTKPEKVLVLQLVISPILWKSDIPKSIQSVLESFCFEEFSEFILFYSLFFQI